MPDVLLPTDQRADLSPFDCGLEDLDDVGDTVRLFLNFTPRVLNLLV